ncbi:MAG: glycosyltransferase [Nanoarchaeota archaeon]
MALINKKMLLACWSINNPYWIINQAYHIPLRKIFKEVVNFDPQEETYKYGKKIMNQKFLDLLKKEKPDYIHLFLVWDEFYPETLIKIKEILPKVKVTHWNGDDDIKFENYTIPYSPAIDYQFISQLQFAKKYDSYHIPWFDLLGADTNKFRPTNLKKKYEVLFVGTPKGDRLKYMRYLLKKKVNFVLGGAGWDDYPEFKKQYLGKIPDEEFVKIINEAKINLCFSQNFFSVPHVLERSLAVNACKSFALTEYVEGYFSKFTEGKDFASFKTEEEMYEKIQYYLKNDKEREKIAENAYKKVVEKYSNQKLLTDAYKAIENDKRPLHGTVARKYFKEKPIYLNKEDFEKGLDYLKNKVSSFKYVCFNSKGHKILAYRDYFQVYSMELIGKPVSICDSMLSSGLIGDYASLSLHYAYNYLSKKDLSYVYDNINISQIMVRKDYFLENIEKFAYLYKNKVKSIDNKDTFFISMPLIVTKKKNKIPIFNSDHILFPHFELNLVVLKNQNKLFRNSFIYKLIIYSLFVNHQILKYIFLNSLKRTKNPRLVKISRFFAKFIKQ